MGGGVSGGQLVAMRGDGPRLASDSGCNFYETDSVSYVDDQGRTNSHKQYPSSVANQVFNTYKPISPSIAFPTQSHNKSKKSKVSKDPNASRHQPALSLSLKLPATRPATIIIYRPQPRSIRSPNTRSGSLATIQRVSPGAHEPCLIV
jgi:hypothetical protein